tara:strand:+ start:2148 stop:2531 length:384 start_codon:yes stop_codon:yes gene_type:complete
MKNSEILNKLYKENALTKDDIYKDKRGFTIITRSGIEQIQYNNKIEVAFEMIQCMKDMVVIKAKTFQNGEPKIETYGSATDENCMNKFKVEVAEKRALARAIIKTMGFTNFLGQDEIENQNKKIVNK